MTGLFTTPFSYQQQTYTAIFSFTECDKATTLSIFLPDESLHSLLPGGHFSFNTGKGLAGSAPLKAQAQSLLVCVLAAIDTHSMHPDLKTV